METIPRKNMKFMSHCLPKGHSYKGGLKQQNSVSIKTIRSGIGRGQEAR